MVPAKCRAYYLKTWFFPDLLSAFPFELIGIFAPNIDSREAIYFRLPRLLKLLRFNFAFRYLQRYLQRAVAWPLWFVQLITACLRSVTLHDQQRACYQGCCTPPLYGAAGVQVPLHGF